MAGGEQKCSMDHILCWKDLGAQSVQLIKQIGFGTASDNELSAEKNSKQDAVNSETSLGLYIPELKKNRNYEAQFLSN